MKGYRDSRRDWLNRGRFLLIPVLLLSGGMSFLAAGDEGARRVARVPSGEAKETIQVLMLAYMKQSLGLSREQEKVIVPQFQRMLEAREQFARQRRTALQQLQAEVQKQSAGESELLEVVARLDRLESKHRELEERIQREIDRSLQPRQQAQLRLFVPRFRQELAERIQLVKELQERPRPAPQFVPAGKRENEF